MRRLFDGDPKYVWAGLIAVFALFGLTATTVVSMYHWPVDPDVIRQTNTTFGNVLTFVLGVFTGASLPASAAAISGVARRIVKVLPGNQGTIESETTGEAAGADADAPAAGA